MSDRLLEFGKIALGVVIFLAILVIPWALIGGFVAVSERLLPWLYTASTVSLIVSLAVFLPLAIMQRTRFVAAFGLLIASFVFGFTAWMMGLLLTWDLWGGFAVFVGLALLGVGVVFTAALATLFNGMWIELGWLVLAVVLTYGARVGGMWLAESSD